VIAMNCRIEGKENRVKVTAVEGLTLEGGSTGLSGKCVIEGSAVAHGFELSEWSLAELLNLQTVFHDCGLGSGDELHQFRWEIQFGEA
jgi:hypothetical protein